MGESDESPLHQRLSAAVGNRSCRHVADITGHNQETVRRYMAGQAPSVEFVSDLCRAMSLSAEWMLTGRGPMKLSEVRAHALNEANASELLSAVAATLEKLIERVERIELYLNTMETRLRAAKPSPAAGADGDVPRAQHIVDAELKSLRPANRSADRAGQ